VAAVQFGQPDLSLFEFIRSQSLLNGFCRSSREEQDTQDCGPRTVCETLACLVRAASAASTPCPDCQSPSAPAVVASHRTVHAPVGREPVRPSLLDLVEAAGSLEQEVTVIFVGDGVLADQMWASMPY